jgi:hypothetical protein
MAHVKALLADLEGWLAEPVTCPHCHSTVVHDPHPYDRVHCPCKHGRQFADRCPCPCHWPLHDPRAAEE